MTHTSHLGDSKTNTNITIYRDSEWAAVQYAMECADGDPKTSGWQTRWTTAMDHLSDVALDYTLIPHDGARKARHPGAPQHR